MALAFRPAGTILRPVLRSPLQGGATQQWAALLAELESLAASEGLSLWYVPPAVYEDRATAGPFINSDQSGGVPTLGQPVGWLKDRKVG